MKVPFFTTQFQNKYYGNEIRSSINDVIDSGIYILGEQVKLFEEKICKFINSKHAIGVASGSDALILSLKALDFAQNGEIITSPFTFFASTSSIIHSGLKPVFVDVDEKTYNINPNLIAEKINNNTKGILPIDLFSQPADYLKINKIAKNYNLKVIEDSAEAFGMKFSNKFAGLCGDIGIFSFFPTKTLGAFGDAGMIVTNNEIYAEKVRALRVHGSDRKYFHKYVGYNSRLDSIQASILNTKLKYVLNEIKEREGIYHLYKELLKDTNEIIFPKVHPSASPVWYVINVKCSQRDELRKYLSENGIQTMIYYPKPMHLQECFKFLGYKKGEFPVTEMLSESLLALPIYIGMSIETIEYVCQKIIKFYNN